MNVIVISDNAHVNGGAAKVAIQEARGLADGGPGDPSDRKGHHRSRWARPICFAKDCKCPKKRWC